MATTHPKRAIAHVAIVFRDYDEAIAFYTGALGFELVEDIRLSAEKRWVLVAPPGSGTSLLLARAANAVGAALVHYSTDFVFDGVEPTPRTEADPPNPKSAYATSKLLGEWFAADVPRHYVLRVESLFGQVAGTVVAVLDPRRAPLRTGAVAAALAPGVPS